VKTALVAPALEVLREKVTEEKTTNTGGDFDFDY